MFGAGLCGFKNDLEACLVNGFWFDLILHNTFKELQVYSSKGLQYVCRVLCVLPYHPQAELY